MGTIDELRERKSVRRFLDKPVPPSLRQTIIDCAINAPTAGNQMLYTILDVTDHAIKQKLARACDNQGFIADAPLVLVFLADCRRWRDAYDLAECQSRDPGVADWLLACQDALIAAQNAVVAAHALGLGSCYIGDVMENREQVVEMLGLDKWVFPAALLVFGFPTSQQIARSKPKRFDAKYVVMTDTYRRLSPDELRQMYADRGDDFTPFVQAVCKRKYMSDFAAEMNRSVAGYVEAYR